MLQRGFVLRRMAEADLQQVVDSCNGLLPPGTMQMTRRTSVRMFMVAFRGTITEH